MRPLQFTPGQLRDIVGLSVETFRHWRRVLPPFAEHRGRAKRFSIGDLLAARVLRQLTDSCGIRVGHLSELSKHLVLLCNSHAWAGLEGRTLLFNLVTGACQLARDGRELPIAGLVLLVPLDPIMTELRDSLLRSGVSTSQRSLLFPPVEVEQAARARGRAS